jgi:type IV pilus assembly protein PilY1
MKNGKWALLLGNGVNSVNERAVLYVLYLDGSGFKKLITQNTTGQSNGLSTPLPVDLDNDGLVDFAYAGDMLGRLWKFDLSSSDDANWKVAQASSVNTALIDTGRPITSAPAVAVHPKGGLLVTFGSGRSLTEGDRSSSTTEYLYGVWDKETPGVVQQATDDSLVTRTLAAETSTITGSNIAARVLSSTSTPVDYATKRGWRITLGLSRERVIYNPIVQGRIAYFSTYIPSVAASACTVQDSGGSLLTFDVIDGAQPATTVVDINGDGLFTSADRISGKDVMGRGVGVGRLLGLFAAPPGSGTAASCSGDLIMGASGMICAKKPPGPGRRAWRDMRP